MVCAINQTVGMNVMIIFGKVNLKDIILTERYILSLKRLLIIFQLKECNQ